MLTLIIRVVKNSLQKLENMVGYNWKSNCFHQETFQEFLLGFNKFVIDKYKDLTKESLNNHIKLQKLKQRFLP